MVLAVALILLSASPALGLDNGLALTPPMGWMSWQRYRCITDCKRFPKECISERLIKEASDLLVNEGFAELGYNIVALDDCWLANTRDEDGNLQANSTRFPSGILSLSNYVHSKGLKFGLYEDYGTKTCAGYPGIIDHLEKDAFQFATWQVDYIKLDGCNADPIDMELGYALFQKYLNSTERPIMFSCSWPAYEVDEGLLTNYTALVKNCNLWRNYDDIQDSWESVTSIVDHYALVQDEIAPFAGPGHWNDPDMLVIGNYGLSYDQSESQMAIWCILAAPLFISTDLGALTPPMKKILQNKMAISINQDALGIQGRLLFQEKDIQVWRRPLEPVEEGYYSYALAFQSRRSDGAPYSFTRNLTTLGLYSPRGYRLHDVFKGTDFSSAFFPNSKLSVRVNPSGVVFLKATVLSPNDICS